MIKKLFPIIFIAIGCTRADKANIYPELYELELKKYIGEEVSIFFDDFNKQYLYNGYLDEPPGFLIGWRFDYKEYSIIIYTLPNNDKNFNPEFNWKLEDFLKEEIYRIKVRIYDSEIQEKQLRGDARKTVTEIRTW